MNDHPAQPAPDVDVAAVQTVGAVLTDLVDLAERLPVPPDQAEATARILDRLSEEIREAAGMLRGVPAAAFPPWRGPRLDGSIPADDTSVTRARVLLGEHHQPVAMSGDDIRHLLSRFQRCTTELLAVIDGEASR